MRDHLELPLMGVPVVQVGIVRVPVVERGVSVHMRMWL